MLFRKYYQFIKLVLNDLTQNKLRNFLTMLGIIMGVAAVIIIMSLGAGAQSLIFAQVKSLGSNMIGVLPGKAGDKEPPAAAMGIVVRTLKYGDAKAIQDNIPGVVGAVAYVNRVKNVSWNGQSFKASVSGVNASYLKVEGGKVAQGRFFTPAEVNSLARVAVLGSAAAKNLFGNSNPVGQKIKIGQTSFQVIGVMAKRGMIAFQNYDDKIFIPLTTMQKLVAGIDYVNLIRVKVKDAKDINFVMQSIRKLLRQRHHISDPALDDFTVRSAAQALDIMKVITDSLNLFLAAMAAISLVVGGIGIMNIMLISVNERTREIGLRKALGATKADIIRQFLVETSFLTFLGGVFGIILGAVVSFSISRLIESFGYQWDFVLPWHAVIFGISVAIGIGLIFGLYPAKRAADLDPIEALAYE